MAGLDHQHTAGLSLRLANRLQVGSGCITNRTGLRIGLVLLLL